MKPAPANAIEALRECPRIIIEATDPDGETYCLRYTEADSPDQAWSLLISTLHARRALLNPMATLAFVEVDYIEFGKAAA